MALGEVAGNPGPETSGGPGNQVFRFFQIIKGAMDPAAAPIEIAAGFSFYSHLQAACAGGKS
jgi:hypothetical protein